MSRDIHMHMELKISGRWEHYRYSKEPEDYRFFDMLVDIKHSTEVPPDLSPLTMLNYFHWQRDLYNFGVLDDPLVIEHIEDWYQDLIRHRGDTNGKPFGYLFGNSWRGFVRYRESFFKEIEAIRIIYWFDN